MLAQTGEGAGVGQRSGVSCGGEFLRGEVLQVVLRHFLGEHPTPVAMGGVRGSPGGRLVVSLVAPGDGNKIGRNVRFLLSRLKLTNALIIYYV